MSIAITKRPRRATVLHNVPWETYVALRDIPENWNLRMTYDRGELEIISPSPKHEGIAALIGTLIDVWTIELDIPIRSCRTMTIRRAILKRGFEPDNCYYVQNELHVWDKTDLDFDVDLPPDLAIEVEVSRRYTRKMRLYASFGVPELWRIIRGAVRVYELSSAGSYVPRETSNCFPEFPIAKVQEIILQLGAQHQTKLVRSFRDWVRENIPSAGR